MKIGFLLNHYDSHQVPHIVPYAFKLSELYPDVEVVIISSTQEQKTFAQEISSTYKNQKCKFVDVKASVIIELIDPVLSKLVFARKSAVIRKNIECIKSLNRFEKLAINSGFRQGYELLDAQSNIVGKVTSGGMSISLGKGIGMAYVQTDALASNEPIVIQIRNKIVPITVTSPPFV